MGGTNLTGQSFTLTAVGDTANVAPLFPSVLVVPVTAATFTFGAYSGTITSANQNWHLNQMFGGVGLGVFGGNDLFNFFASGPANQTALDAWTMTSSIGPTPGSTGGSKSDPNIPTTAGTLNVSSISSWSFQATVTPTSTPEPGTYALAALGLLIYACRQRLRNSAR